MTTLIHRAAAIASQLLPPLGDRWLHVQAVAERAVAVLRRVDQGVGLGFRCCGVDVMDAEVAVVSGRSG